MLKKYTVCLKNSILIMGTPILSIVTMEMVVNQVGFILRYQAIFLVHDTTLDNRAGLRYQ